MRLSVIIPVYNEASTLAEVLRRVKEAGTSDLVIEIVAVDDASTDDSPRLLELAAADGVKVIRHARNQGKGAAIRSGLAEATGDAVIIQDADLEYDPRDYEAIIAPMRDGNAEVVYGSRILGNNSYSYRRFYYGGRFLTLLFNLLYGGHLTDLTTCYKAFRRQTIASLPLRCTRFEFCPEVTARLARRGIPIREVPIRYRPRSLQEGKKIRWHDGLQAIWTLIALRW